MKRDVEGQVIETAAELFALAIKEAESEAQWDIAVDEIVKDVRKRHPDISIATLAFAMGRAVGRLEGQKQMSKRR
jgi:hypothetical protein